MTDVLSTDFSEPGFLKRLRNWRDAMPWLVLGECLQPATSVIAMTLAMFALFVGSWGTFTLERTIEQRDYTEHPVAAKFPVEVSTHGTKNLLPQNLRFIAVPSVVGVHQYMTSPIRAFASDQNDAMVMLVRLVQQFWLFAVWVIPAGYVMRRSALAVSGRERMPSVDTIKLSVHRWQSFLSAPALTIGVALVLASMFLILGYVDHIPYVGRTIAAGLGLLSIPIVLVIGLLVFGTVLSFSLMWASIVSESYADGFDAASRSFEYIIQRPFRFAAYVAMSLLLSIVVLNLASGIVASGVSLAHVVYSATTSTGQHLPPGVFSIVTSIPTVLAFNLFWSFSAGIYLLLRRDANHQDVEEVWEPERPPAKPLPELAVSSKQETKDD